MNLIQRAKNIVLSPQSEWEVIAPETTSTGELYKSYIAPLSAIGPIASFIGLSVVGVSLPFMGNYRVPFLSGLSMTVVSYVLGLVGIYVIALIIDALAPTFGGEKNQGQALKVAAYAATPAWIAGVLHILPALGILALLAALYSLYVLYLGLPVLMKSPKEKAVGYTVVVVICAIVLSVVIGLVGGMFGGVGKGMAPMGMNTGQPGVQAMPPEAAAAMKQMQQLTEKMEAANKEMAKQMPVTEEPKASPEGNTGEKQP